MTQIPPEGQFFTLNPVQPKPKPSMNWGLPLAIGALAIPLLMFGFGFSQQQTPSAAKALPTASPSAAASPETSDLSPEATAPNAVATPASQPTTATTQTDSQPMAIARIHAPGLAANFRNAPSLHSQPISVLRDGDLVELQPESRVMQDGVTWVPVQFRGQLGWVASNFLGGRANGL